MQYLRSSQYEHRRRKIPARRCLVATLRLMVATVACGLVAGCGAASTFFLVGNVVNAAGTAAMEHQEKRQRARDDQEVMQEAMADMLQYRAAHGDLDAQYRLGLLYQSRRRSEARGWICRAAQAGHPGAQLQMGHWYSEDRSGSDMWPFIHVSLDDREAYVWYSLAERNGEPSAPAFRKQMELDRMSVKEIDEANRRLSAWEPGGC